MDHIFALVSESAEQTHALGRRLGRLLSAGDVVGLVGELGAGKTRFVQGVAQGAEVLEPREVCSPTFTLINEYPGRLLLIHVDLYRLGETEELWELGLDDYAGGAGACVVEWFDRFADELPREVMILRFEIKGDQARRISVEAEGERHQRLARAWRVAAEAEEPR